MKEEGFPNPKEYTISRIPKKKRGKFRQIEAPSDTLKAKQRASVQELNNFLYTSPFAHAFTHNKNIVTMAMPHVGKPYILAFDLSDFFPSINFKNLTAELDRNLNYRGRCKEVTKNHNMTTKQLKEKLHEDLKIHMCQFKGEEDPRLPQGAPGSPMLSNVFLHNFDWFASKKAAELGVDYSRYADDVVMSGEDRDAIWRLFYHCFQPYLNKIGLKINKAKTKFMTSKHRQVVCGLVVNVKVNIKRRWRKNLRAELHQQGTSLKDLEKHPEKVRKLRKETRGKLAFRHMVYEKDYKNIVSSREFLDVQKVFSVGGK